MWGKVLAKIPAAQIIRITMKYMFYVPCPGNVSSELWLPCTVVWEVTARFLTGKTK
jgi:hypothetical protein